ncbi:MAG: hypothetical protein JO180_11090, partial [Gemmatirosa sp.]|nr:hypothetical protein [Gemmatirosa sp.]
MAGHHYAYNLSFDGPDAPTVAPTASPEAAAFASLEIGHWRWSGSGPRASVARPHSIQVPMSSSRSVFRRVASSLVLACIGAAVQAQATPNATAPNAPSCLPRGFFTAPASYASVEVGGDRRVTFRFCAPAAAEVLVTSSDYAPAIPMGFGGGPAGLVMTKDATGLWTATTTVPVEPGTYRYAFRVDGAKVPDPQATRFSEER